MNFNKKRAGLLFASLLLAAIIGAGVTATALAYWQPDTLTSPSTAADPGDEERNGVVVVKVDPDSPAAEAGLERGSVILKFNGQEVGSFKELRDLVLATEAGDEVTITVLEDGAEKELKTEVGCVAPYLGVKATSQADRDHAFGIFGDRDKDAEVDDDDSDDEVGFPEKYSSMPHGRWQIPAVVVQVVEGSAAEAAGLKAGDRIVNADGKKIYSVSQLVKAIDAKSPGDVIELVVIRGDEMLDITATLGEDPDNPGDALLGIVVPPKIEKSNGRGRP